MHRFESFVSVVFILVGLFASPAAAEDIATCRNEREADAVDACSRLIASGKWQGRDLAFRFINRGNAYVAKGNLDQAIADFNEAIQVDPKTAMAFHNRGNAYGMKGEPDRAVADLNEAIRLDPKYIRAIYSRGFFYSFKGDLDRAIADYDQVLGLDPAYTAAYAGRGLAYEKKGERERAKADFNAALALPTDVRLNWGVHKTARERLAALAGPQTTAHATTTVANSAHRAEPSTTANSVSAPTTPTTAETPPSPTSGQPPPIAASGRRVALVIGNGEYRFANRLPNPPNDAADLAKLLKKLGFEVIDGLNLDHNRMVDTIREFGRKLDQADTALFFYAGHGLQVSGNNYYTSFR